MQVGEFVRNIETVSHMCIYVCMYVCTQIRKTACAYEACWKHRNSAVYVSVCIYLRMYICVKMYIHM